MKLISKGQTSKQILLNNKLVNSVGQHGILNNWLKFFLTEGFSISVQSPNSVIGSHNFEVKSQSYKMKSQVLR